MEVKNPMVDQLLVNTVQQAPANPGAKPPKDAETPDFDSMVHQKRSTVEKGEAKPDKPQKADAEETPKNDAPAEGKPVTDEQYAIAAAMMFQAQPDARYTAIQAEAAEIVEAAPELVTGTAQPAGTEAVAELPETPMEEESPAEPVAENAEAAVTVETPEQTAEAPEAPARRDAAPVEEKAEQPVEARQEPVEAQERPGQTVRRAEREEQPEPVRVERRAEAPAEERTEERQTETEDAAAQLAQEAPLFERVEAPVVKVAETPVPLEAENGAEQLGEELGGILVNSADANRIEVTLTPENLGKLTVEVTRSTDGTLNVVLHPTTERAAALLEKGVDGLRQALASNTGRETQIQVRGNEEPQRQFLNPDGQNEQNRQQQQQQGRRQNERHSAQDFLQQLRLGLVDVDGNE